MSPRTGATLVAALGILAWLVAAHGERPDRRDDSHAADELLVAPADGVAEADLQLEYGKHGGRKKKALRRLRVHRISVPAGALEAVEAALRESPKVKYVERNFEATLEFVPDDPGYGSQWHLPRVSAPAGWDLSTGDPAVVIAVIDSGIDPSQVDLAPNLVPGYNFVSNNTDTRDVRDHGTAVAGTAAAMGNEGRGVAGLAWRSRVMPLLVTGPTTTYYSDVAEAITYAADRGARVINLSLGGTSYSSTLQSAVNYAWNRGVVVVAAAGNSGSSTPFYPAALDNVVAVAATDQSDLRASFSNYGTWIDVAAPGTRIYTTNNGGGYGYWQGTSFASPQVAGLAALMFAANPGLTNAQVVSLLRARADDLGAPGFDATFGSGRINVARAVQAAAESVAGDAVAPTVSISAPADGSSVSGTVTVTAAAADNVGVTRVALYVDGILRVSDVAAPWTFAWSTAGLSGTHTLVALASDAAGNSTQSLPVKVGIADRTPPTVAITGVVDDGKYLTVTASATDAAGPVVRVDLLVNGAVKASDSGAPWSFRLNTKPWPRGTYTVTARGYDGAGNVGLSGPATFTK